MSTAKKYTGVILGLFLIVILAIVLSALRAKTKPEAILPIATPNIAPEYERKSFIKNMEWVPLQKQLPSANQLPSQGSGLKKLSFNKKSSATIANNQLLISDEAGKVLQKISLESTTKQASFVWLTNDYLLLIEKQTEDLGEIDWVYLVGKATGDKEKLVGSFPIPERLDLTFEPKLYDNGHIVVLLDNEKNYWALTFKY